MQGRLSVRSVSRTCAVLTVATCALLPFLTACAGGPERSVQSSATSNGPMSDPITGLQPQTIPAAAAPNPTEPTITEAQIGIPFYPNALPAGANSGSDSSTSSTGDAMMLLQTHDPAEKVVAYYMDKLTRSDATGKQTAPIKSQSTMDGKPVVTCRRSRAAP